MFLANQKLKHKCIKLFFQHQQEISSIMYIFLELVSLPYSQMKIFFIIGITFCAHLPRVHTMTFIDKQ